MFEKQILFYNFGIFLLMIPILFKAFMAFDLDKFFKKGYDWQKQLIYMVVIVVLAKGFANVFSHLVEIFLALTTSF